MPELPEVFAGSIGIPPVLPQPANQIPDLGRQLKGLRPPKAGELQLELVEIGKAHRMGSFPLLSQKRRISSD
jgi:hypothetical protein